MCIRLNMIYFRESPISQFEKQGGWVVKLVDAGGF